jgi:SAM-dependent methyltransferase
MRVIDKMVTKFLSRLKRIYHYLKKTWAIHLIQSSKLFDKAWYLANNLDVVNLKVNPASHYLLYGGFEGRDPSPNFSSKWYLDTYEDVRRAGINPLVHYLKYGKEEGRTAQPQLIEFTNSPYKCPICQEQVDNFLPLSVFFMENFRKFGYPYTPDEAETINVEQYSCPHCGASDRDRLYACYLSEKIPQYHTEDEILLLDIAPSQALSNFIEKFKQVNHLTADLLVEGTDLVVDITNMPEIDSNSYDILICSHVLEHVSNDKKALSELYRVLKPGGWGIIMVPIILTIDQIDEDPQVSDIAERWRRFGQYDHVRLYSKSGFIERVKAAGFELKQLGRDHFGESAFRQYGITNKSVLYIAEK